MLGMCACTATGEIVIDGLGVEFARDGDGKADCEGYSAGVRTGGKAGRGAARCAVGGVVGDGIVDDSAVGIARGAGVGAVSGAVRGLSEGERQEVQVVKRCLRGRGYRVLN